MQNAKDYISDAVKHAAEAPVLCESVLRNLHAMELAKPAHGRLMEELERQRTAGEKIHVDNAMKVRDYYLVPRAETRGSYLVGQYGIMTIHHQRFSDNYIVLNKI